MKSTAKKILITIIALAATVTLSFAHIAHESGSFSEEVFESPALDQLALSYGEGQLSVW